MIKFILSSTTFHLCTFHSSFGICQRNNSIFLRRGMDSCRSHRSKWWRHQESDLDRVHKSKDIRTWYFPGFVLVLIVGEHDGAHMVAIVFIVTTVAVFVLTWFLNMKVKLLNSVSSQISYTDSWPMESVISKITTCHWSEGMYSTSATRVASVGPATAWHWTVTITPPIPHILTLNQKIKVISKQAIVSINQSNVIGLIRYSDWTRATALFLWSNHSASL